MAWSELQAKVAGDDFFLDVGGAAEDRRDAVEPPELTIASEISGPVLAPVKPGSIWSARAAAFARCDLGGDHAPGDRLAAWQLSGPRRGPDDHAEPAAADIPAVDADVDAPVSSSRHSCHKSSGCTIPATAARCGRAPASRRAVIRISAGVRTLTMTAWARPALDDHRSIQAAVRRMGKPRDSGPFGERCALPLPSRRQHEPPDWISAGKCHVPRLWCRAWDKPPSRYEVTVRVAKDGDQPADPATFAVAVNKAASSRNASVVSAHTAEEVICVVSVAAPDGPAAVAVALAVVADALRAGDPAPSPSR